MPKRYSFNTAFVSVPMKDREFLEISNDMVNAECKYLHNSSEREGTRFVNNLYISNTIKKNAEKAKHPELIYLAEAIRRMANCDDVIFAGDWEKYRGCQVEKLVYDLYFTK